MRVRCHGIGGEALEKAKNVGYQMMIIDTRLLDIHGVDVAQRIRKPDEKTNLIVLADDSTFNDCIDLLDYGVEDILIKPVESNEFTGLKGKLFAHIKTADSHESLF